MRAFEPAENVHRDDILHTCTVPAGDPAGAGAATPSAHAAAIVAALDYVGVLGVEFFVARRAARLLVNEIAPRVHNSGHWTEAVCVTDQFEQHIRAIAGWPLGDPTRLADVVMENLIGDEICAHRRPASGLASARMLYGKRRSSRPGRKMGHLNRIDRPKPRQK